VDELAECELAWETDVLTNTVPVPLCSPQIPYDLIWDRTWAAAVGSQSWS
jgi:hypothetical protein